MRFRSFTYSNTWIFRTYSAKLCIGDAPARAPPPPSFLTSMQALLRDAKLEHVSETIGSQLSLEEALGLLALGRPKLLDRLKELGVARIPDRQAAAKAIASGKRDIEGTGVPVLLVLYSTGLLPADGRRLMSKLIDAASEAGFKESLVLDHCNEEPYAGKCASLDEYVRALWNTVCKAGFEKRPFIIVAHSNGTVGAYGLAKFLKAKVRALCVIGRRPPSMPLLPDAVGVETCAEVHALPAHQLAQAMCAAYTNPMLASYTSDADESKWQPQIRAAVQVARDQYGSPCVLGAAADIAAAIAPPIDGRLPAADTDIPSAARVHAPIYAIASGKETERGETAAKMEAWAALTSAKFEFVHRSIESDHMAMCGDPTTIELTVAAMKPYLPPSSD